jgi:hypothetical protein
METAALISLSLILMVSLIYNVLDYKIIIKLQAKLEEGQDDNLLETLFLCDEINKLIKGNGDDIPYLQEEKSASQVIEELNILFPSVGDFWGDRIYSMDATYKSLSKAIISGFTWRSDDIEYFSEIYVLLLDMEEEGLV